MNYTQNLIFFFLTEFKSSFIVFEPLIDDNITFQIKNASNLVDVRFLNNKAFKIGESLSIRFYRKKNNIYIQLFKLLSEFILFYNK